METLLTEQVKFFFVEGFRTDDPKEDNCRAELKNSARVILLKHS